MESKELRVSGLCWVCSGNTSQRRQHLSVALKGVLNFSGKRMGTGCYWRKDHRQCLRRKKKGGCGLLFGDQSSEEMMKGQEAKGSDARLKHLDCLRGRGKQGQLSGSLVAGSNLSFGTFILAAGGVGWGGGNWRLTGFPRGRIPGPNKDRAVNGRAKGAPNPSSFLSPGTFTPAAGFKAISWQLSLLPAGLLLCGLYRSDGTWGPTAAAVSVRSSSNGLLLPDGQGEEGSGVGESWRGVSQEVGGEAGLEQPCQVGAGRNLWTVIEFKWL